MCPEIRDKTGLLIYKIKQEHKQTPASRLSYESFVMSILVTLL